MLGRDVRALEDLVAVGCLMIGVVVLVVVLVVGGIVWLRP
jgi:hypothetical protein